MGPDVSPRGAVYISDYLRSHGDVGSDVFLRKYSPVNIL